MELHYNRLKKRPLVGFFWFVEDGDIELSDYENFARSVLDENIGIPVVGFADDLGVFDYTAKENLSLEFAGLKTPCQLVNFIEEYGSLFGAADILISPDNRLSPIGKQSDMRRFFEAAFQKPINTSGVRILSDNEWMNSEAMDVACFEFLEDWLQEIALMNVAYTLAALQNEDFTLMEEDTETTAKHGRSFSASQNEKSLSFKIVVDNRNKVARVLLQDSTNKSDFLKTRWKPKNIFPTEIEEIESNNYVGFCSHGRGFVGFIAENVDLSSTSLRTLQKEIRILFKRIIQWLVSYSNPSALFRLLDDRITYEFSSLKSYLWFDFACSINDSRGFSLCARCGKPFLKGNRGKKKKFCSDSCRKLYSKQMLREAEHE